MLIYLRWWIHLVLMEWLDVDLSEVSLGGDEVAAS